MHKIFPINIHNVNYKKKLNLTPKQQTKIPRPARHLSTNDIYSTKGTSCEIRPTLQTLSQNG